MIIYNLEADTMWQPLFLCTPCMNRERRAKYRAGGVPAQERDARIDPTTDDYYGPGNSDKVAAARERARRKLAGASSRESFTTAAEMTPGVSPHPQFIF